jgi:hypothetical protein
MLISGPATIGFRGSGIKLTAAPRVDEGIIAISRYQKR